jgi:hypothetical protein
MVEEQRVHGVVIQPLTIIDQHGQRGGDRRGGQQAQCSGEHRKRVGACGGTNCQCGLDGRDL